MAKKSIAGENESKSKKPAVTASVKRTAKPEQTKSTAPRRPATKPEHEDKSRTENPECEKPPKCEDNNYVVSGQVTCPDNTPAIGVDVAVINLDAASEEKFGTARTDANGHYSITFTIAQNRFSPAEKCGHAGRSGPNFLVRVYAKTGEKIGQSESVKNAGRSTTVNITVSSCQYTVCGQVTNSDNTPAIGVDVAVINLDSANEDRFGTARTDANGQYSITFNYPPINAQIKCPVPGKRGPNFVVRAYAQTGEQIGESDPVKNAGRTTTVNIVVNSGQYRVFGEVRDANGELLNAVTVQAFDRDMRSEQLLGKAVTVKGKYEIHYSGWQFSKAEAGTADLVMTVLSAAGVELYKTPVQYNAPAELELNITLQGEPYKGESEWDTLTRTLTPLLDGVSPSALREDDQFQDISFLAGDTGNTRLTIGTWSACYRLADKTSRENTPLSPESLFAFLRQGQPSIFYEEILDDLQHPERMALFEDQVLRNLTDIIPDLQRSLLEKAVADNLVPARIKSQIDAILATLASIKLHYTADSNIGGGAGTIGQLLEIVPAAKDNQAAFLAAYQASTDSFETFWQKVVDDEIYSSDVAQKLKRTFEVGALTFNHIPLVGELVNRLDSGALKATRDLAKYGQAEWVAAFKSTGPDGKPVGVPANIEGDTEQARMEQFATTLDQQFEREYPTTSYAAKLLRSAVNMAGTTQDAVLFFDNNPDFELNSIRLDRYVAANPDALRGIGNKESLVSELKSTQRIFKLNPTYTAVNVLRARQIDSAQSIYFVGKQQFVRAVSGTGISNIAAQQMYLKAEATYALALATFGDYNFAMNGVSPFAVAQQIPDLETQGMIRALPNLQSLFGSLDYCECRDCRSVYSPAAYFVDVMRFLGKRMTNGKEINFGKNVRKVLLERRPDLGEIELSCENTNTPLPYIDLVNEILEDAVSPPDPVVLGYTIKQYLVDGTIHPLVLAELWKHSIAIGEDARTYAQDRRGQWAVRDAQHAYKIYRSYAEEGDLVLLPTRQTFLSAAELRANPEYTNIDAYTKLQGEVFPFNLPFDLWLTQARTYLAHLGVPLPRLLEMFQQRANDGTLSPTDVQIECAWLDISETERQIHTGELAGWQPWDYWGLAESNNNIPNPATPSDPSTNITGGWIDVLSNVDVMLNRSGLSYKELLQLLDMRCVQQGNGVSINDTPGCDTTLFTIKNLGEFELTRMHRFIRLWRKLGCTMWELDIILMGNLTDGGSQEFGIGNLENISRMKRLRDQIGLDWRGIYSFYGATDHHIYLDRSLPGTPAVQTLYQRLFCNKLVDAVASFPPSPDQFKNTDTIANFVSGILAALRINESDFNLILGDLRLVATGRLGATVLRHIYRITVLAKALGLSIDQFLRLKRLWAQDPFANPAATLAFMKLADQVSKSGFSVAQLDYLLAHQFSSHAGVALEDKVIAIFIATLRDGLLKIDADIRIKDIRIKSEEANSAYVKSKLELLPALVKDTDQAVALAIIDGTWQGTSVERNKLIDDFFRGVLNAAAKTELDAVASGLSSAERQAVIDQRFAYVQPLLQSFLLHTQQEALVRQKVGELLQLDMPSTGALLDRLKAPGKTATTMLSVLNDERLIQVTQDGAYQFPSNEDSFPDIYKSLRLLHKDALVIGTLRIKADELTWWLEGSHAADMGWMHPGDFPVDSSAPLAIGKWVNLQQFFDWKNALPKSDLTAFEFFTRVLDSEQSSAANLTDLAQLTAVEESDLKVLVEAFHWRHVAPPEPPAAFDDLKLQLRQSSNLKRLTDCMNALRRLGVNAERAINWATATPDNVVADGIKQTVKAKYDLIQWQQIIGPMQDNFREQKRAALVSWLVAHPDQSMGQYWTDSNGLYGYFLIDVEMSACMLTSRLKQATASVQLFVQRCLLNLEVDIFANTELDDKWNQWKWMKLYRLWEANRKVFLYPENWLEPELRDEKSPFFKDLENELMQNDITAATAEDAYLNYLEKLDKVANLEIRTLFNQSTGGDKSVIHVFGRTRSSQAPEYYYRKRINGARWTTWEKVELDINANHLVAGIHNNRLYLLWPQFLEKANAPVLPKNISSGSTIPIAAPTKYWEIRLNWSELKKSKWTPKVLSDAFATVRQWDTGGDKPENVTIRTRFAPNVQVRLYVSRNPEQFAPTGALLFDKTGRQVSVLTALCNIGYWVLPSYEHIISPAKSRYCGNLILHTSASQYFYYQSVEPKKVEVDLFDSPAHANAPAINLLNNITPNRTYTVIDSQAKEFLDQGSFFMWDQSRTYFVDYDRRFVFLGDRKRRFPGWELICHFDYFIHYHPFVELFIKELNNWGIKGLLNRRIQVNPSSIAGAPPLFDFNSYRPTACVVRNYQLPNKRYSYPVEDVDFSYKGAYAPYNWELFFHVPFYIANKLSANQRFEEALQWFHYIFDPTSVDTTTPYPNTPQQKFWITKPFYETTKADYYRQKIENIMLAIANEDAELRAQVDEWRSNPFNPHLVARMRTVAYQKNVLIKYIQTLLAWGDQIFRRDTIESLNEATQLYILAASILGPRPKSIPKNVASPIKTFYQLEQDGIDDFGNALKEVENLLPALSVSGTQGRDAPELPHLNVLYFGIPNNDKLLSMWDTVADRLFKIRHCMNIEGVVRQLPLFEPPIDPAMLIKAAAAGLDIGSVIGDMNAPMPLYRFSFMIQRALEICSEVKSLGSAMLSALEKRDAEAFAQLRSSHERIMLDQVRVVKEKQVDEALRNKEALDESRNVVVTRRDYYQKLGDDGWNAGEHTAFGLSIASTAIDVAIAAEYIASGGLKLIPSFLAGTAGFGGTPTVTATTGGEQVGNSAEMAARTLQSIAAAFDKGAALASTVASYERRSAEWEFQKTLAATELPQIDKQITAADLRHQIAIQDLKNHDKQIENQSKEQDYLLSKFTNQELYDWMLNQISTVYFQSYQLAYDIAKRAERSFRYELGLSDTSYIQFGYWDSLRKGLLSGEKLHYDLKRLETAYYEQNRRDYELSKHISLVQLDPIALLKLRQNGECFVDVPEAVFDMDYPGHYFRRLKTVGLSIPCVVGPYTTVACTLTLTGNSLRKDSTPLAGKYARDTSNDDPRFRDEIAAIQSIATSNGQNDHGMFELNFRDERYLPFEGAGAISRWHIKLNKDCPQFDFSTISDVVMHLNYTAREGGDLLRSIAVEEFNKKLNDMALAESRNGLFRVFDLKREYSDRWYKFLHPANAADDQELVLDDLAERLPYFTRQFAVKKVGQIEVVAQMKDGATYKVQLSPLADLLSLTVVDPTYQGLHRAAKALTGSEINLGAWTLKLQLDGAADFKSLPVDAISELFLVINYTIT